MATLLAAVAAVAVVFLLVVHVLRQLHSIAPVHFGVGGTRKPDAGIVAFVTRGIVAVFAVLAALALGAVYLLSR